MCSHVYVGGKTMDVAHSNVQEGDLAKFPPSFALYLDYFPAPNPTWKWVTHSLLEKSM